MVREFLITVSDTTYPAAAQVELPPGVQADSWAVINKGSTPVALAFDVVRKAPLTGTGLDDLTVDPAGGGPASAFALDYRARRIWLRATRVSAPFVVQLVAGKAQ